MNPKTANLDPNQKEAYDRVMGTASPTIAAANTPQVTNNIAKPQTQVVTAKNKGKLSPILIFVAVVLFLIVYTIIWAMIFKLKLPFLSF